MTNQKLRLILYTINHINTLLQYYLLYIFFSFNVLKFAVYRKI